MFLFCGTASGKFVFLLQKRILKTFFSQLHELEEDEPVIDDY